MLTGLGLAKASIWLLKRIPVLLPMSLDPNLWRKQQRIHCENAVHNTGTLVFPREIASMAVQWSELSKVFWDSMLHAEVVKMSSVGVLVTPCCFFLLSIFSLLVSVPFLDVSCHFEYISDSVKICSPNNFAGFTQAQGKARRNAFLPSILVCCARTLNLPNAKSWVRFGRHTENSWPRPTRSWWKTLWTRRSRQARKPRRGSLLGPPYLSVNLEKKRTKETWSTNPSVPLFFCTCKGHLP